MAQKQLSSPDTARTMKQLPRSLQPRELLEAAGAQFLSDDALLAIILKNGVPGCNAAELARNIIVAFGSIEALSRVTWREIVARHIKGIGKVKALEIVAALELGRRGVANRSDACVKAMTSPETVFAVLHPLTHGLAQEVIFVLLLDTKHRLMGSPIEITRGLLNSSQAHPREIFKQAIRQSAFAVIVVHNHPSGDPTPSKEDVHMTQRLLDTSKIVGIPLLDHIIIGEGHPGYVSLRERALVAF